MGLRTRKIERIDRFEFWAADVADGIGALRRGVDGAMLRGDKVDGRAWDFRFGICDWRREKDGLRAGAFAGPFAAACGRNARVPGELRAGTRLTWLTRLTGEILT